VAELPESVPGVVEVERSGPPAKLLIEIPHGATRGAHFDALRARLYGDYSDELREFFHVNTDVGAPETAAAIAGRVRELAGASLGVVVLRGLVPRTFVDVNRTLGEPAPDYARTGLTPGVPDYVSDERDRALLREIHERYLTTARAAYDAVCGRDGLALILHSYAPRSVDVGSIDAGVGRALRKAYEPGTYERWPVRPEIEIIDRTPEGETLSPPDLADALLAAYGAAGFAVARNETYRLDARTTGWVWSTRHRDRVVCMEINRGLVADPFEPFREMRIDPARVLRVAEPAARVLAARLSRGG
jgi:hypothetical protein